MKKSIQPNIWVGKGDVAKYALLGGAPERIEKIASYLEKAEKVADHRGYVTYTGKFKGIEVSASCHGVGAPSASVVVEELANVGVETFIRVGTTGAIQPGINIGDLIIANAAVRDEGLTSKYVDIEYPAVADGRVTNALIQAAEKLDVKHHIGVVVTSDAFYASKWEHWNQANAISVEMECSAVFILARMRKLKAGAILTVDGNIAEGTRKSEFGPGEKTGDIDERVVNGIEKEIEIALKAIELLES
ncbi:MAG: nucleoside phosphorylase [Candidatus Hadarchaeota archaeon]|nr:nucleoside phosphorylase [Candidatus Hadarchaeota archaeon]